MVSAVDFETLVNFDASTLTGSYQLISSASENPARTIFIYNTSTSLILFSLDGSTDKWFCPPSSGVAFDCQANADTTVGKVGHYMLRKGQALYAKTSSATDRLLISLAN